MTLLVGGSLGFRGHLLAALDALRPQSSCTLVPGARVGREQGLDSATFGMVIVDLSVTDADPATLLGDFHSAAPSRPIVALVAVDRRDDVLGALRLGAAGVLSRDASREEVQAALRTVLEGGVCMPNRVRAPAVDVYVASGLASVAARECSIADLALLGLTARQTEVLRLLLQGQSNKTIARALNLSVETIKDHVAAVLRGLSVHSRTQAVLAVERILRDLPHAGARAPSLQSVWQPAITSRVSASA